MRLEEGSQDIVVDGEAVGQVTLTETPSAVVLEHVELLPDWRGRGVGSAMLHELWRLAARRVEVDLFGEEVASSEFFERRGFTVVDFSPQHRHLAILP